MNFAVAVDEIRTFLNKPQQEYRSSEQRKPDLLSYKDINKDGSRDFLVLDKDHNGIPDRVLIDRDFNGTFEYIILDENENKIPDGEGFDTNNDGSPDYYLLDLNEDKKTDLYGFDDDQDGEIDRYSRRWDIDKLSKGQIHLSNMILCIWEFIQNLFFCSFC